MNPLYFQTMMVVDVDVDVAMERWLVAAYRCLWQWSVVVMVMEVIKIELVLVVHYMLVGNADNKGGGSGKVVMESYWWCGTDRPLQRLGK